MLTTIKGVDFKTVDYYEVIHTPPEVFEDMTYTQAVDILQKQVDSYHEGGVNSPRAHFGKTLELAVEALREKEKILTP